MPDLRRFLQSPRNVFTSLWGALVTFNVLTLELLTGTTLAMVVALRFAWSSANFVYSKLARYTDIAFSAVNNRVTYGLDSIALAAQRKLGANAGKIVSISLSLIYMLAQVYAGSALLFNPLFAVAATSAIAKLVVYPLAAIFVSSFAVVNMLNLEISEARLRTNNIDLVEDEALNDFQTREHTITNTLTAISERLGGFFQSAANIFIKTPANWLSTSLRNAYPEQAGQAATRPWYVTRVIRRLGILDEAFSNNGASGPPLNIQPLNPTQPRRVTLETLLNANEPLVLGQQALNNARVWDADINAALGTPEPDFANLLERTFRFVYGSRAVGQERINWLRASIHAPRQFWSQIPPQELAALSADQENQSLVSNTSNSLMSIPVYLDIHYLERGPIVENRTYMDLSEAFEAIANSRAGAANSPFFNRNMLRFDRDRYNQIQRLRQRVLNPAAAVVEEERIQVGFDETLDLAIVAEDLNIFWRYLQEVGGASENGLLINWTPRLRQELANSRYAPARYWADQFPADIKAQIINRDRTILCGASGELPCISVMISTGNTAPARYDLISLLTKMQAYEVNPRNEDEITALNEIQFDPDEKNYIASIISAVTEPVGVVRRQVQHLEEEEEEEEKQDREDLTHQEETVQHLDEQQASRAAPVVVPEQNQGAPILHQQQLTREEIRIRRLAAIDARAANVENQMPVPTHAAQNQAPGPNPMG